MGGSIKLVDLLREIGDPKTPSKPYDLEIEDETKYVLKYSFETDAGNKYIILIVKDFKEHLDPQGNPEEDENGEPLYNKQEQQYTISFGVMGGKYGPNSLDVESELKDTRNLFRVMATVIEATKEAVKNADKPVTRLLMQPVKRDIMDRRRENLYKTYIKQHTPPGSEVRDVKRDGQDTILVELPNAVGKVDWLPKGETFPDARRIDGVFKKSSRSWSEVQEATEKNRENAKETTVNTADIHITQPNVQANKVKKAVLNFKTLPTVEAVQFPDGEIAIADGHHRLTANWALGNKTVKVKLARAEGVADKGL